jgi:hypothetical protein
MLDVLLRVEGNRIGTSCVPLMAADGAASTFIFGDFSQFRH